MGHSVTSAALRLHTLPPRTLTRLTPADCTATQWSTAEEKAEATRAFADHALPLFASSRIRPVVDAVYPMDQAAEAHRRMESNLNFGKLVLSWDA